MSEVTFQTSVRGGLPVLVTCRLYPAEPDVGAGESAEIEDICWLSGKSVSNRVWRSIPQKDFDRLEEEALSAGEGEAVRWFWERVDYARERSKDRELERSFEA